MSGRARGEEKMSLKEEGIRSGLRSRGAKSPARKKSPSRTPKSVGKRLGSKSPSRRVEKVVTPKKQSPSRATPSKKSPSRIPRSESFKEPKITTSTPILDIDTDSDMETKIPKPTTQIRGRTKIARKEYTIPSSLSTLDFEGFKNRITRSMTPKKVVEPVKSDKTDRIVHLKGDYFTKETKLIEYSDEDDVPYQDHVDFIKPSSKPNLKFRTEYGGMWGTALLIIILPLLTITLVQYTFTKKYPNFYNLSHYYDLNSYLGFFIFALINFAISLIPLGQKPEGLLKTLPSSSYRANGFLNFIISLTIIFGIEFYGIHIMDYINEHYLQLTAAGLLFSILLSMVLFVKAHYVPVSSLNVMGDTDSVIYNFFIGKEVTPFIFGVHMKIYLIRLTFIGRAILATTILVKSLDVNKIITTYQDLNLKSFDLNYTLLTVCFMTYITVFDRITFEKSMASTFEIRYEGHGYLANVYFMSTLFLYGFIPKYVYDAQIIVNLYVLGFVALVFFFGLIVNRGSLNQKYHFRVNPFSMKVAHLSTIPIAQGKKLLCGGFWSVVRHPNYFGELLMNLSYAMFTCGSGLLIYILLIVPAIIYRATRQEFRARHIYEAGWERYCQNVKKMIIPKIL